MALDFVGLRTEVFARGFAYLNDGAAGLTRVKRWINEGMHAIDDLWPWPYLQATATGTAPLSVADLGLVESVVDTSNSSTPLEWLDRQQVTAYYGDLTVTGTPAFFYITAGSTINVYPANTSDTLTVRYTKFAGDLVNDTDAPSMPDRFREAIVEHACARAYRDKSNEQEAIACFQERDRIVDRMRSLYDLQSGAQDQQHITFASDDW